jgi:hypothetical protein
MELPYHFPDPLEEAARRAREFQQLPPDERWRQVAGMMELALTMVRMSPRRAWVEKRLEEQETEWRRIQQELFTRHGR